MARWSHSVLWTYHHELCPAHNRQKLKNRCVGRGHQALLPASAANNNRSRARPRLTIAIPSPVRVWIKSRRADAPLPEDGFEGGLELLYRRGAFESVPNDPRFVDDEGPRVAWQVPLVDGFDGVQPVERVLVDLDVDEVRRFGVGRM